MLKCIVYWCIVLVYLIPSIAANEGVVRLYRDGVPDTSQSWSSGIVQIYYSSQWGNICDDSSFGSDEADVICHQLGYTGASSYSNTGLTTIIWGSDSSSTLLNDVSCSTSSYLTITQCSFSTIIKSSCTNRDVIVTCYSTRIWATPSPGDIRLTGGTYSNQGLLEVYCNGQWGTVCDDSFDSTEARIACEQLGYNHYVEYDHLPYEGNLSQYIWLDTFTLCSSDSCLTSCGGCPSTPIPYCVHTEDVTLECEYTSYFAMVNTHTSTDCSRYLQESDDTASGFYQGSFIVLVVGVFCGICVFSLAVCLVQRARYVILNRARAIPRSTTNIQRSGGTAAPIVHTMNPPSHRVPPVPPHYELTQLIPFSNGDGVSPYPQAVTEQDDTVSPYSNTTDRPPPPAYSQGLPPPPSYSEAIL